MAVIQRERLACGGGGWGWGVGSRNLPWEPGLGFLLLLMEQNGRSRAGRSLGWGGGRAVLWGEGGVVPTEASELWLGSLLLGLASQVRAQRPGREGSLRAEYI